MTVKRIYNKITKDLHLSEIDYIKNEIPFCETRARIMHNKSLTCETQASITLHKDLAPKYHELSIEYAALALKYDEVATSLKTRLAYLETVV